MLSVSAASVRPRAWSDWLVSKAMPIVEFLDPARAQEWRFREMQPLLAMSDERLALHGLTRQHVLGYVYRRPR